MGSKKKRKAAIELKGYTCDDCMFFPHDSGEFRMWCVNCGKVE